MSHTPDYDKLLSKLDIQILGVQLADYEDIFALLARAARWADVASEIHIAICEPERDGSVTHIMKVVYREGGSLTIGCLRRAPGDNMEFHS